MTFTAAELRSVVARTDPAELPSLTGLLAASLVSACDAEPPLTIGEVADLVGTSVHTLRWYERIGLLAVPRSPGGQRSYDTEAIGRVVFITRLRLTDLPIAEIRSYLELVAAGPVTVPQRLDLLERHRAELQRRIDDLQFSLAVLDYKIAGYGGACTPDPDPTTPERSHR